MPPAHPPLLQELSAWLKDKAQDVFDSLQPGTDKLPKEWPEQLCRYYHAYNGQKREAAALFAQRGNWFSVEDAMQAQEIGLAQKEEYDFDWYKASYFPIAGCLDGDMQGVTVIDTQTGEIGDIDFELQEFSPCFKDIDGLFHNLLSTLKTNGYPPKVVYKEYTREERDLLKRQEALALQEEYRQINDAPSARQLFVWGTELFRKGAPEYGTPNLYTMQLAKQYYDQVPLSELSQKQLRQIAFFKSRYEEMVKKTRPNAGPKPALPPPHIAAASVAEIKRY